MLVLLSLATAALQRQEISPAGSVEYRAARIADLVNLARYPIDSAELSELVRAAQRSLEETGVASFPGFLTADATSAAAAEAIDASPTAWVTDSKHNAWQSDRDASLPPGHIVNLFMRTRVASVAYDQIGPTLRALYESAALLSFLSALLGRTLYRLADPLGAASINVFREGWDHAYHFDEAEYTVTLSLRASPPPPPPLPLFYHSVRSLAIDWVTRATAPCARPPTLMVLCGPLSPLSLAATAHPASPRWPFAAYHTGRSVA